MSKTRPYPHPSPRERRAFLPTTNAHDACLPPAQADTSYRSSVDENDVYLLSGGAENTGSVSPRTEDTRVLSYRAQKVCPLSPAERRCEGEGAPRISSGLLIAAKIALVFFSVAPAMAQPYPAKPVRILTSAPGNSDDLAARLIAQGITGGLGQQTVVDNRGVVAVEIAVFLRSGASEDELLSTYDACTSIVPDEPVTTFKRSDVLVRRITRSRR